MSPAASERHRAPASNSDSHKFIASPLSTLHIAIAIVIPGTRPECQGLTDRETLSAPRTFGIPERISRHDFTTAACRDLNGIEVRSRRPGTIRHLAEASSTPALISGADWNTAVTLRHVILAVRSQHSRPCQPRPEDRDVPRICAATAT